MQKPHLELNKILEVLKTYMDLAIQAVFLLMKQ